HEDFARHAEVRARNVDAAAALAAEGSGDVSAGAQVDQARGHVDVGEGADDTIGVAVVQLVFEPAAIGGLMPGAVVLQQVLCVLALAGVEAVEYGQQRLLHGGFARLVGAVNHVQPRRKLKAGVGPTSKAVEVKPLNFHG